MIDLSQTTFIIPVRIDSPDRAFNFGFVLQYLCNHLKTNIIISEDGPIPIAVDLLHDIKKGECKISAVYNKNEDSVFHRTRLLNEMTNSVKTPVICVYDIDVFLAPEYYKKAQDEILNNEVDMLLPYGRGMFQKMIDKETINSEALTYVLGGSQCGHLQFFNTFSYKCMGMENEGFISYGPEDQERLYRAETLGYTVKWLPGVYVHHIEHARDENSSEKNPHFKANVDLFEHIKSLKVNELKAYYRNCEYLKKYSL